MDDLECHSPRPFIEKQVLSARSDICDGYPRLLAYNPDPVQRFENSNNSPHPGVTKTFVSDCASHLMPCNDLDLSMLDGSSHIPRKPINNNERIFSCKEELLCGGHSNVSSDNFIQKSRHVLSPIENKETVEQPGNIRNNMFFIRRDNLKELNLQNVYPLQNQLSRLSLNKENVSLAKQAEIARLSIGNTSNNTEMHSLKSANVPDECRCHHCVKLIQNAPCRSNQLNQLTTDNCNKYVKSMGQFCNIASECEHRLRHPQKSYQCSNCIQIEQQPIICHCRKEPSNTTEVVDKKTWMLKKYDRMKQQEVANQSVVVKEKREPTVADLFKIIKLQNEQLQLLQEKVDKFISTSSSKNVNEPGKNYMTEQAALETAGTEHQKISVGVMTSFEMVRTSTVINKETVTQTNESGQIQCNRSQISIREVISRSQQGNPNFLDGITPFSKEASVQNVDHDHIIKLQKSNEDHLAAPNEIINDDKTLNELSLYNVQVDNAITPLLSPEQSLYLDVRDYSDSDSGSDDNSNVGWTYYNKVMTHVNGMLQDSDMPSSASAMYRNTRQQCIQMQIDKTNVSVTKRVKFGDDPLGIQQPHIYTTSTDTSLKMNQLAAKYLKNYTPSPIYQQVPVTKLTAMPTDMSFATRNYMERHKILQGGNIVPSQPCPAVDLPKFLDITTLKQQPKFL
ncbi:hypothetical protein evm_002104 [Chilo suppressalis]|nr:hypothetical protein evm_002104 [Chilo suppressalis]